MTTVEKSLSTTQSSVIMLSPDTPEAHTLRSWYDSQSGQVQLYSLSQSGAVGGNMTGAVPREEKYRTLAQIKEDQGTLSTTTVPLNCYFGTLKQIGGRILLGSGYCNVDSP